MCFCMCYIYVATGVLNSDWRKSVAEPEMEFDDIGTDIALSQGEVMLRVCVCVLVRC